MKVRLGLLAAALLPSLAACQKPAPVVDVAKEAAAINAQIDVLNSAMRAKDATRAVAIVAPDIRSYGGGQDAESRDEDLKGTRATMADPAYAMQTQAEHTEVAKSGDIAFQTGSWEGSATNPTTKAVEHWTGRWVGAWRKDADGMWRLAAVSATTNPSPGAPADAPMANKK